MSMEPWAAAKKNSWHLPYSRGKPQKTSARRPSNEGAVRPVITSNEVPFLQMRSVGSHSTSGREKEGIKGVGVIGSVPSEGEPMDTTIFHTWLDYDQ